MGELFVNFSVVALILDNTIVELIPFVDEIDNNQSALQHKLLLYSTLKQ